jgi:hypothetical protein
VRKTSHFEKEGRTVIRGPAEEMSIPVKIGDGS